MLGLNSKDRPMGKATEKSPPSPASGDGEDPVWGDLLAGFFGVGRFATPSATPPAEENKPAPKKPVRKLPRA